MEYVNLILYIGLLLFSFRKKWNKLAVFIVFIWLISAFVGIFYCKMPVPLYKTGGFDIELFPFIYLFVCLIIGLLPIVYVKPEKLEITNNNEKFIALLIKILALTSITPFIEVLVHLGVTIANGQFFAMAANYDDIALGDVEILHLTWMNERFLHLQMWFRYVTPVFFFYTLIYKKQFSKFYVVGIFLSAILSPVYSVTSGARTGLIFISAYLIALYFIVEKKLHEDIKAKLKHYALIGGSILGVLIVALTVGRFVLGDKFAGQDGTALEFIAQYTAEPMYNFNNSMWHEPYKTDGYYTFSQFFSDIGIDNNALKISQDLSTHTKYTRTWFFFTYIGNFFLDYGAIITFFILCILSLFFCNMIRKRVLSFSAFLILSAYIYMIVNGLFYFPYVAGMNGLYVCIGLALLLKFIPKKRL